MSTQYIGARYVVKIYENKTDPSKAEWDVNVNYEPLTLVTYNNGSYMSKKDVPASIGNPVQNPLYWVQTGFYNGQVVELQNHVSNLERLLNSEVSNRTNADTRLQNAINTLETRVTNLGNTLSSEITAEANARSSGDNALREDINTNSTNISTLSNSLSNEVTARSEADTLINSRIDEIVAPTGEAPNPAEITDARIGADGTVYNTLGDAIRTQVSSLSNSYNNLAWYGVAASISPKGLAGNAKTRGRINNQLKWVDTGAGTPYHFVVPINGGDEIVITANDDKYELYAILTAYSLPLKESSNASMSAATGYTEPLAVNAGNTVKFTAPSDAAFLYCLAEYADETYTAESIIVNDIEVLVGSSVQALELKNEIGNGITITERGDTYYPVKNGADYYVTNNGNSQLSLHTKISGSETEYDYIIVNPNTTEILTCTTDADIINIWQAADTTVNTSIMPVECINGEIENINRRIANINNDISNLVSEVDNSATFTTTGYKEYKMETGKTYKITNDGSSTVSFRIYNRTSSEELVQFYVEPNHEEMYTSEYTTSDNIQVNIWQAAGTTVNTTITEMGTLAEDINVNADNINALNHIPPSYYQTQLNSKIPSINDNMANVGRNGETFVFITDVHWSHNDQMSPDLIWQIAERTEMKTIVCGGDIITMGEKESMRNYMIDFIKSLNIPNTYFLCAFGNHDSNWEQTLNPSNYFDYDARYAYMGKEMENYVTWLTDDEMSFYYDNKACKTRYIVLDTGEDRSSEGGHIFDAYDELAAALNDTPSGWHIIIVAHIITYGQFVYYVEPMLDAYNSRSSYTKDGTTYSFTNGSAFVEMCIGGHTHEDGYHVTSGGIPVVVTTCDGAYGDDYEYHTVNSQAFDVVTCDYVNKTINCVRIGRGSNRTFNYGS